MALADPNVEYIPIAEYTTFGVNTNARSSSDMMHQLYNAMYGVVLDAQRRTLILNATGPNVVFDGQYYAGAIFRVADATPAEQGFWGAQRVWGERCDGRVEFHGITFQNAGLRAANDGQSELLGAYASGALIIDETQCNSQTTAQIARATRSAKQLAPRSAALIA